MRQVIELIEESEEILEYSEYLEFFAIRIAKLRTAKGVSAREMGLSIGLSRGYITQIERKQNLPSMTAFLKICDYLEISPKDFFDDEMECPEMLDKLFKKLKSFNRHELESVVGIVDVISELKSNGGY